MALVRLRPGLLEVPGLLARILDRRRGTATKDGACNQRVRVLLHELLLYVEVRTMKMKSYFLNLNMNFS
jgi:hypothetical protein